MTVRLSLVALALAAFACTPPPRVAPIGGAPAPARIPRIELPAGHQQVTFTWRYSDEDITATGDGVARIAAPDSARLDFFVSNGMGGGAAVLIRDQLDVPGPAFVRRLIPPPPMLWAAFGRLVLPPAADTVARVSGDTLRAEVGSGTVWRATFVGPRVQRVDRIVDGRAIEHLTLATADAVQYVSDAARRSLTLTVTKRAAVEPFDVAIWTR